MGGMNFQMRNAGNSHMVVKCSRFVETHVMVSKSAFWKNGREIWSVIYNEEGRLEVTGALPTCFTAILDRLTQLQQNEDDCNHIFDVPISVAAELTGFRYDDGSEKQLKFETLLKLTFLQKLLHR